MHTNNIKIMNRTDTYMAESDKIKLHYVSFVLISILNIKIKTI